MACGRARANFGVAVVAASAALLLICLSVPNGRADPQPGDNSQFTAAQLDFFEKQVQPILKARCLKCHGGEEKIRGGLRLTSRANVLKGGDQGPAAQLEKAGESLLLAAINYDGLEMPPSGKLPQAEIDVLTRWVQEKLPWTAGAEPGEEKPKEGPPRVDDEARNYWAYRPLAAPAVPSVQRSDWVRNPIDAFILHELEAAGLSPNPPADRVTLIRRAFYDLIGLPPSPDEVEAFVSDKSDDAYERLIDELLATPQYGEKWGRHWLDLVRFAETHGYERDSPKPFAWRYRDYVIDSFNRDKPYDRFLLEQLAGDELDAVTPETLIATGYYRLGLWDDEPADRLLAKYDVLDGIVSTTGQLVLGMTVGCARCHDHKKDPLPQRDYYRLLGFFRDVTDMDPKNTRRIATDEEQRAHQLVLREKLKHEGDLYQQLFAIEQQAARAIDLRQPGLFERRGISDIVDLKYRLYRDTWRQLPDFDSLKPESAAELPRNFVTLAAASRPQAIGLVFEGRLNVPKRGEYLFSFRATEGVRLIVDGRAIVDQAGRGDHEGTAKASLSAGLLPMRLEYFNADSKPELRIAWEGPGVARRLLSDESTAAEVAPLVADSRLEPQEWAYTTEAPDQGWTGPRFDDASWKRGPGGFGTMGTPGAVVRTQWNSKDIWLRRKFHAAEVPPRLALQVHHDDQVEVYLNGRRVFESRGYLVAYKQVLLPRESAAALAAGENVVAVHCHQTTGGQYIDVGLASAPEHEILKALVFQRGDELLGPGTIAKYAALGEQFEASRKQQVVEPGIEVMCVAERGRETTHVLIRGNPGAPGAAVEPGFPEVLTTAMPVIPERTGQEPGSGKRLALAEWLTSAENPVTPRVMANRVWQFHFGRGIVPTPNDFGKLGEPPTHPELLDWLAVEFRRGGWKLKPLHKLVMTSNSYRMSSAGSAKLKKGTGSEPQLGAAGKADADEVPVLFFNAGLDRDPGNRLFWRFNMRRLSAEEVRDSILAVAGTLNLKAGGPGVYPPIPKEVLAGQSRPGDGWGNSSPTEAFRRSVYVHVKRSLLVPILEHHDLADTDSSCAVRFTTTVPTQALGMLNGEFTNEQAAKFAERLEREAPGDVRAQVVRGIRLTSSRPPAKEEIERDIAFIKNLQAEPAISSHEALTRYCLLLLNANEFVYLD
jgi:hypothetical protein